MARSLRARAHRPNCAHYLECRGLSVQPFLERGIQARKELG